MAPRKASTGEVETESSGKSQASLRRERKRAIDRESQRLSRARTRAYITQLEQTIEELNSSKTTTAESSSVSLTQLKQQCEENRKLKAMIGKIHRMTQEVAGALPGDITIDSLEREAEASPKATESTGSTSVDEEFRPTVLSSGSPKTPASCEAREPPGSTHHPVLPTYMGEGLQYNAWLAALSSVTDDMTLLKNHFEDLNARLSQLELSDPAGTYTGPEEDDDILIRASLHGWAEAKRRHTLDSVWLGVELMDRTLFYRFKPVERAASIRVVRTMLMKRISPIGHLPRKVPYFMNPTKLQSTVDHASLIDYFAWPELRDTLVVANAQFASELSTAWFCTNVRVQWPYRVQDMCKYEVARDLYSFSSEFESTYGDLQNWVSPFGDPSGSVVHEAFCLGAGLGALEGFDLQGPQGMAVC